MRNAVTAYASSTSTDVAAYEDLPSRDLLVVRNLITTTNDESYHGSANKLPPTTSHGYAEWDFSEVPDPVMFQRFLDAADYWFGYSDDSSAGSYDPACECFVVVVTTKPTAPTRQGLATEKPLGTRELVYRKTWGRAHHPVHRREAHTSMRIWLKLASSRLSLRRSTARYDCFVLPSPRRLPRVANAHAS
jgi:hypothetical protein